jgi:hypothetical protein
MSLFGGHANATDKPFNTQAQTFINAALTGLGSRHGKLQMWIGF